MIVTVVMDVDFALLREQKLALLARDDEASAGLVALLDHIQDYVVDSGQAAEGKVFSLLCE